MHSSSSITVYLTVTVLPSDRDSRVSVAETLLLPLVSTFCSFPQVSYNIKKQTLNESDFVWLLCEYY